MAVCIVATDPEGGLVVCHEDTWTEHIVAEHAEMTNRMSWVEETIKEPLAIYASARDTNSKVFHRQYDFGASLGNAMLRVVVRYKKKWVVGRTAGTIITAYAANGPKVGEVLIWPQ